MSNIAIIPARGGSKRIPRKNIKEFNGMPLLAYSIAAAKSSGLFQHIIVSTNDDEIAAVANAWGAETPFARPENLADDHTPTAPVIAHAINACIEKKIYAEYVCCIYPTCPFLNESDLFAALKRLKDSEADFSFPVAKYHSPIQRALKLIDGNKLEPFDINYELKRTQDLEPAYYDAGQFYWGSTISWLNMQSIYSNSIGLPIPSWRAIDIDNQSDWDLAELIYCAINLKNIG
jgi:pseudaminic acid cytidylyltransferase